MRILLLANGLTGLQILRWLTSQGENLVGLVIHPPEKRRHTDEMLAAIQSETTVIDGSQIQDQSILREIAQLRPEIAISVNFGYILRQDFLDLLAGNVVNLHTGLLPHNRGAHPNVWSIIEGTPAGVTLHYVDEGIDTGDVIATEAVDVEPVDTGSTLYRKLEVAAFTLFQRSWPLIKAGRKQATAQNRHEGSYHRSTDLKRIECIDLDRTYTARELLAILRARTFRPYDSAYFVDRGKKVFVRVDLEYAPGDGAAQRNTPSAGPQESNGSHSD